MDGPKRMREEGSPELRRILGSSSIDEPPPGSLQKTLKHIGLVGAASVAVTAVAGTAAAKTASPAVSAGLAGLLKWGAVGVVAGSLTLGTVKVVTTMTAEREEPAAPALSVQAATSARAPTTGPIAPVAGESRASAAASAVPTTPRSAVPAISESAAPPVSSASSLKIEMQELEAVRRAIAQGRGAEAIGLLDVFAAQHPRARLSEEAAVLRIEALMASGASGQARSMAEEFLRTHPNSAFGDRMRSLAGDGGAR